MIDISLYPLKTYRVNGPSTISRTRECHNIVIGPSGVLELWHVDRIIEAFAPGEWSQIYEEVKENE